MPYDASSPLETQIHTSVASSLRNLRSTEESADDAYLDCLLLHSPLPTAEETLQAWALLESYVPDRIRSLGISNVTLPVLHAIYENSSVKPAVAQNRFYPQTRYDVPLPPVATLAQCCGVEPSVALYALVMNCGIVILNGTTSSTHMRQDLQGPQKVQDWIKMHPKEWESIEDAFYTSIGVAPREL
ncbi:hypothetical protein NX059_011295 [Plenodomus lindquistii]|nr:hypothetical protein NX059_011295 [Plenodomus lindquistii]